MLLAFVYHQVGTDETQQRELETKNPVTENCMNDGPGESIGDPGHGGPLTNLLGRLTHPPP